MDKRIELNHTHNNGEGGWKDADGVIYTINNDGATACAYGSDKEISNPNIVIANEVAIDGNVYPVTHVKGFYFSEILKSLYLPTNIKVRLSIVLVIIPLGVFLWRCSKIIFMSGD